MFLPVEQTGEATAQGDESDAVESSLEENVEERLPETTDDQFKCSGMGEVNVETGQVREGAEEDGTITGTNPLPTPKAPRRNAPRNRGPPTKLTYESRATESEDNRQKIERGRKLWQRAKARRAAGDK